MHGFMDRSVGSPSLVLWVVVAAIYTGPSDGQTSAAKHNAAPLEVTLKTDRGVYDLGNQITVTATVKNISSGITYLYGFDWGESASFSFWIKDANSGADIQPMALADALPPPPVSRQSLLALSPLQVRDTTFTATLTELGIIRSGNYQLGVSYHCPLSKAFAFGLPIWGRDNGVIESNRTTTKVVSGK